MEETLNLTITSGNIYNGYYRYKRAKTIATTKI